MSVKQLITHAVTASILSIAACLIYNQIYSSALDLDFSRVLNVGGIIGASVLSCLLMSLSYYFIYRWNNGKGLAWVNILIAVVSFATVMAPLAAQLPVDLDSPELFPGLAIPMHFFPALSFFTIAPFFKYKTN